MPSALSADLGPEIAGASDKNQLLISGLWLLSLFHNSNLFFRKAVEATDNLIDEAVGEAELLLDRKETN